MLTKSPAARTALVYVTIGALILIWTTVWWIYIRNHPSEGAGTNYILGGLFGTGFILLVIGLGVGRLGSSARHADNPAIIMSSNTPPNTAAVVGPPNNVVAQGSVAQPPQAPLPAAGAPAAPIAARQ